MPPINYDNTATYTYTTTTTDAYTTANADRINRPITFYDLDGDDAVTTYRPISVGRIVTMADIENWFKKIYKIISEHTHIDISEEEFLNILAEK